MAIRCSLGFIYVCCLVTSNKIVAVRSLHSIRACSAHAVQASHCNYYVHVQCMYVCLLDISRQLACMKLGRREKYQPIQYCWAGCLGYPVHTCHLPIDIQQIYCSAQTGQHSHLRRSCCPVWTLQHIYVHTCMYLCAGWLMVTELGVM